MEIKEEIKAEVKEEIKVIKSQETEVVLKSIEFFPYDYLNNKKAKRDLSLPILSELLEILDKGDIEQQNYYKQWAKDLLIDWTKTLLNSKIFRKIDNGLAVVLFLLVFDIFQTTDCANLDEFYNEIDRRFVFDRYQEEGWMCLILPKQEKHKSIKKAKVSPRAAARRLKWLSSFFHKQTAFLKSMIKTSFDTNILFELLRQSTNEEYCWNQYLLSGKMNVPRKNFIPKTIDNNRLLEATTSIEDGTVLESEFFPSEDFDNAQKQFLLPLASSPTIDEEFWNFMFEDYLESLEVKSGSIGEEECEIKEMIYSNEEISIGKKKKKKAGKNNDQK